MPIQFQCQQCGKTLTVPDEHAGKTARCPQCQAIVRIPGGIDPSQPAQGYPAQPTQGYPAQPNQGTPVQSSAPISNLDQYFVINSSGQSFGPATKAQLDGWVAEGRIQATDMIQQQGMQSRVAASQMYPSLANPGLGQAGFGQPNTGQMGASFGQSAYGQPAYGQPAHTPMTAKTNIKRTGGKSSFRVVNASVEHFFGHAWEVYKENWGIVVGGMFLIGLPVGIANYASEKLIEAFDPGVQSLILTAASSFAIGFAGLFLFTGYSHMCLKLCRGQRAEISDIFSGYKFLPFFLARIPVWVLTQTPVYLLTLLIVTGVLHKDMSLFIVPLALVLAVIDFMLWPLVYVFLDDRASFPKCYGLSFEISVTNFVNLLLTFILMIVIVLLGFICLIIGAIFAIAFCSLILPSAYLAMTNQLRR